MKSLVPFIIVIIAALFLCTAADASNVISPKYSSVDVAVRSSSAYYTESQQPTVSVFCKAEIRNDSNFLWYVSNSLCVRNKNDKMEAYFFIDKKVNKGKEIKARFQYNLRDGQTLYREYLLFPDKASGDVLFLIHDEDVAEFMRLSRESAIVKVTYNTSPTESESAFFPM
ncbi:hypothetical protein [Serratia phage vB_SmaM_Hera]|uniref:Uncharacterized protein n=1 Tax=Serratia phage vB_SmaM_Hera TaxID=2777369 RepID=A0A7T3TKK5_9CAUD|nr:hypothetical protein [Serratia phage vB_SmaM_Hera]